MFYSSDLLGKRSPLGAVWMTAHGKRLAKKNILSVSVVDACDTIMDPAVPHALRLQAVLVGGLVLIHSKQTLYILEDAEAAFRQLLALAASGGAVGADGATLLPAEGGGAAITLPAASLAGLAGGDAAAALAALAAFGDAAGGLGALAVPGVGGGGPSQLFGGLTLGTQGLAGRLSAGGGGGGGRPSSAPLGGGADEDLFLMPATSVEPALSAGRAAGVAGILDRLGAASPGAAGALAAAARGEFGCAVGGGGVGGGLAFDGYLGGDGLMEAPPGAGNMEGLMMMMDGGGVDGGGWEAGDGAAAAPPLWEGGDGGPPAAPAGPPPASAGLASFKLAAPRLDSAGTSLPTRVIREWIGDPAPTLVGGAGGRAGRTALGGGGGPATHTAAHGRSSAAASLAAAALAVPAPDTGAWPEPLAALLRGAMREGTAALPLPKAARAAKRRKLADAAALPGPAPMVGPDGAVDWGEVGAPMPLDGGDGWPAGGEWGGGGPEGAPWTAAPAATGPAPGGMERLRHALLGAELAGPLAAVGAGGRGSSGSSGRLAESRRGSGSGPAGSGDRPPSDGDAPPRPAASSGEGAAAAAAMAALADGDAMFLTAVPEEGEGEAEVEGGRAASAGADGDGFAAAIAEAVGGPGAAAAAAAVAARKAAAMNPATRTVLELLRARFAAQAAAGKPAAVSLDGAASALGSRAEAARLFFNCLVGTTAGYLRAAQPGGAWTDITLAPGPAMRGVGAA